MTIMTCYQQAGDQAQEIGTAEPCTSFTCGSCNIIVHASRL